MPRGNLCLRGLMPNWEVYKKAQGKRGGRKIWASLNATKRPYLLLIGKLLKNAGFEVSLRYEILFDRNSFSIGLRASEDGLVLTRFGTGATGLRLPTFCKYFEINGRFTVESVDRDGDIWILPLSRKTEEQQLNGFRDNDRTEKQPAQRR